MENESCISSVSSASIIHENNIISRQIPKDDVELLSNLIEKASLSYSNGDLDKALYYYDQAVLVDPANNVLYANRSVIYLKLGKIQEAIDEAQHSIQLNPEWAKAYYRKAEALNEGNDYEKAIITYCQAIHLDINNEKFLTSLITSVQKSYIKDNFNEAYKQMKELSLEKSPFVVISVIGQTFLYYKNYEISITVLKIALDIDSPSLKLKESTIGSLAKSYYEIKNYSKSIDYLELQLELLLQLNDIKAQIEVHDNISKIALMESNYQLALIHKSNQILLSQKIGINPRSFVYDKGEILEKLGEIDEACACYNELLRDNPEDYDVNMKLGNMFIHQNLYNDAIEFFNKAKNNTNNSNLRLLALIRIGQCKLILGDDDGAIDILKNNIKNNNYDILCNVLEIFCKSSEENNDISTLYKMGKRLLKIGIELNHFEYKTKAYYFLATFYDRVGQTSASEKLYRLYVKNIENSNLIEASLKRYLITLEKLQKIEFDSGNCTNALNIAEKRLSLTSDHEYEERALIYSDLISIYRIIEPKNDDKRLDLLSKIKNIIELSNDVRLLWIYDKEMGNYYLDKKELNNAKELYEKALITVQELNKNDYEIIICKELGNINYTMNFNDEAIMYYNQYLMLSQNEKNSIFIMDAHKLLSKIYMDVNLMDNSLDHVRCYLTLSTILSIEYDKLLAFIMMGKIFYKKEKYQLSLKILIKAKKLAITIDSKKELAICYGLLGKINLKIGLKDKGFKNFCKQLSLFSFIDDIELKCESIKHLINEKYLNNDINWTLKLINLQQNISKEGKPNLQIDVLRNSSGIFKKLNLIDESIKSLEKALLLSIEYEHNDTVTILLELTDLYLMTKQYFKGINTLNNFKELQDGLCGPSIYYQLGLLYYKENMIDESLNILNKCKEFDIIDNRFVYILICVYYKKKEYDESIRWIEKLIETEPIDVITQEKLLWERFLLNIYQNHETYDIENELLSLLQISINDNNYIYLDKLNLYRYINGNLIDLLSLKTKIHYYIHKNEYFKALNLLLTRSDDDNTEELSLEGLIINYFIGNPVINSTNYIDNDKNYYYSSEKELLFDQNDLLLDQIYVFMLLLSLQDSLSDSIYHIELLKWKIIKNEFEQIGIQYPVAKPTIEDIGIEINNVESFIYVYKLFNFKLLWIKIDNNHKLSKLYYLIEAEDEENDEELPLFYKNVISNAIKVSNIPEYSNIEKELFNEYLFIGDIFSNNTHNRDTLMNYYPPRSKPLAENDIIYIGNGVNHKNNHSSVIIPANNLTINELYSRISSSLILFMIIDDVNVDEINLIDFYKNNYATKVVILQQSSSIDERIDGKTQKMISILLNISISFIIVIDNDKYFEIEEIVRRNMFLNVNINEILDTLNDYYHLISSVKTNETIEIIGLSKITRSILKNKQKNEYLNIPEKYQIIISQRIEKIFQLSTNMEDLLNNVHKLENDIYPYSIIKKYFNENELLYLLFGDYVVEHKEEKEDFSSDEITNLMRSFDVRKRWRRSRKSARNMNHRNCVSDGEQQQFSDKDLTDTESISGAKVIGIELDSI